MGRFYMKYAIEFVSDAMVYIPGTIKIDSGYQKLISEIHRHTCSMMIS
jgi:hypothetical protein